MQCLVPHSLQALSGLVCTRIEEYLRSKCGAQGLHLVSRNATVLLEYYQVFIPKNPILTTLSAQFCPVTVLRRGGKSRGLREKDENPVL